MSAKKSVAKSVAEAAVGSPPAVECVCDTCKRIGERMSADDLKALYPSATKHDASVMHYMREYAMKSPPLERRAGYYMQSEGLGGASTKKEVTDQDDCGEFVPADDDAFPFMVANFNIYGAADPDDFPPPSYEEDEDDREERERRPKYKYDKKGLKSISSSFYKDGCYTRDPPGQY